MHPMLWRPHCVVWCGDWLLQQQPTPAQHADRSTYGALNKSRRVSWTSVLSSHTRTVVGGQVSCWQQMSRERSWQEQKLPATISRTTRATAACAPNAHYPAAMTAGGPTAYHKCTHPTHALSHPHIKEALVICCRRRAFACMCTQLSADTPPAQNARDAVWHSATHTTHRYCIGLCMPGSPD